MRKPTQTPQEILLFSDEYPPDGGGAGVVAQQLANDLRKLGQPVRLLVGKSRKSRKPDLFRREVPRFTLVWPIFYLWNLLVLRIDRFPTIILNDYISAYISGLFFTKKALNKSIIIVHGDDGEFFFKKTSAKHKIYGYKYAYMRALKHCKLVISSSKYAREEYLNHTDNLVSPNNVTYAYMGIDPEGLGIPSLDTKTALGVQQDSILLFSATRLIEEKGLLDMLDLFQAAIKSIPNLYWHIAGEGPLKDKINAIISKNNLQDHVKLVGFLNREELSNYYQLSDIFWLLSKRKGETFGLVFIEAAWFGTPSIALRIGGVPEAIAEGISGYFYSEGEEPTEAIRKALALSREKTEQHARQFSSEKFARKLLEIVDASA